jgi:hypothetical protein
MGKVFESKNIRHEKLFDFGGTVKEYPLTSNLKCLACKRNFDTVPVHIPIKEDEKSKIRWSFDPFVQCSLVCAIEIIISRKKSKVAQVLGLLCKFAREHFGFGFEKITYVSITCVEGFCDKPLMTMEEYWNSCGVVTVLLKQPSCMFIDTWVEVQDSKQKEEQRKKEMDRLLNTKATPEQQSKFADTMRRMVDKYQGTGQSIEHSPIGKTLGIKENKK